MIAEEIIWLIGWLIGWLTLLLLLGIVLMPLVLLVIWLIPSFPPDARSQARKRLKLYAPAALLILLMLSTMIGPELKVVTKAHRTQTEVEMRMIRTGLANYEIEYGVPMRTGNNAHIINTLCTYPLNTADNPRSITFLTLMPKYRNAQGEALDAWGTPFRIDLTDPEHPKIQSAGPDRKWGTADDMSDETPR